MRAALVASVLWIAACDCEGRTTPLGDASVGEHDAMISPSDAEETDASVLDVGAGTDAMITFDADCPPGESSRFTFVRAFGHRTCAIRDDLTLWCWGNGLGGPTPTQAALGHSWRAVGLGGDHLCAIDMDGLVWCWGSNEYGQLGIGTSTASHSTPIVTSTSAYWEVIEAGEYRSRGIQRDHTLWAWGWDVDLADGTSVRTVRRPFAVGSSNVAWKDAPFNIGAFGGSRALREDGSLWAWGIDLFGDLGLGVGDTFNLARVGTATWIEVSAGVVHACGIQTDGSFWCWGSNDLGELGLGDKMNRTHPTRVGVETDWIHVAAGGGLTCGVRATAGLWCWGCDLADPICGAFTFSGLAPVRIETHRPVLSLSAGGAICFIDTESKLWCFGPNDAGQLGTGDMQDRGRPTLVCFP
jgi:alpha-tubulin suppressor-like RCC1 family protein